MGVGVYSRVLVLRVGLHLNENCKGFLFGEDLAALFQSHTSINIL